MPLGEDPDQSAGWFGQSKGAWRGPGGQRRYYLETIEKAGSFVSAGVLRAVESVLEDCIGQN
jgi:hypothetical protein